MRLDKILGLIKNCKFGIHDLSRTEIDPKTKLPRFNMPLELGIFLGAKRFGGKRHKSKNSLVTDRDSYRYREFISDIAGQDIGVHDDDPATAIKRVRNWLQKSSGSKTIPGGAYIVGRYEAFTAALPAMCKVLHLAPNELTFPDFTNLVAEWLKQNAVR